MLFKSVEPFANLQKLLFFLFHSFIHAFFIKTSRPGTESTSIGHEIDFFNGIGHEIRLADLIWAIWYQFKHV